MIRLQPVAMPVPNSAFIYQPNQLSPVKEMDEREFLQRYADSAVALRVRLDGKVETVTAYGRGLDAWYIVQGEEVK